MPLYCFIPFEHQDQCTSKSKFKVINIFARVFVSVNEIHSTSHREILLKLEFYIDLYVFFIVYAYTIIHHRI